MELDHIELEPRRTVIEEHGSSGDESFDEEELVSSGKLDISKELADRNYEAAGVEVAEDEEGITLDDHYDLLDPLVNLKLDEIVAELKMPYLPTNTQRIAINAIGQMKNVVLVSPTGSGKLNVPLLGTLVLRSQLKKPKGRNI